jgi:poly(A) polymerase
MIKTALKDAILDGVIPNNYNDAYNFVIEQGKKLGLQIQ